MDVETPYAFVQRRRAEGASAEVLRAELTARGHASDEVALLLGGQVSSVGPVVSTALPSAGEATPWALVKKLRSEGYPPEAIARELEQQGVAAEDVRALLVDERVRAPETPEEAGAGLPVQLIFGVLLVLAGGLLILGGRISLLSIGLVLSGLARAGSAFASERGTSALKAEARKQMAALPADDPRARCAVHQDFASIGSCPRCGSFCCARCTPARGFAAGNVCMQCQVLPEVREQRQKSAARLAALILLTAPLALVFFAGFELAFTTSSPELTLVIATVGIGVAPWLGLAAVQANVRGSWPLIISVLPWLMIEILLARGNAGLQSTLWLVPLGAAFYGWANLRQAGQLEEALVVSSPGP